MYFLRSEDAIIEKLKYVPNHGISYNLMELVEHITGSQSKLA